MTDKPGGLFSDNHHSHVPQNYLKEKIERLKREKNAIILAHYYQSYEIQEIADFVGDSLALSQQASSTEADIIVFAGVHFMAETAKILSPDKKVLLPDINAGCSLADDCAPEDFEKWINQNPDHYVISYINCSARIKALSDIICTSSNAAKVVGQVPQDKPILFAPDVNLGRYLQKITGRNLKLWNGACIVHDQFSIEKIEGIKSKNFDAKIIAHPECSAKLLEMADFIGSTAALLKYTLSSTASTFIIVTEEGILHQMKNQSPEKVFIPAPLNTYTECACGECPYMKMNTLEKLYQCLKDETPEIEISGQLIQQALKPLKKMMALG